jgi:hypothetical protein
MSFDLPNMNTLRKALEHLKKHKVKMEDPGDEIGPEVAGLGEHGRLVLRSRQLPLGVQPARRRGET